LYKLFVVVAVYCAFFRLRQLDGTGGDMIMPTVCATIASVYVLFRASALITVVLPAIVGGIVGFNCRAVHYKGEPVDLAAGFIGALIGAAIGLGVGAVVIASRKWDAHEKWLGEPDDKIHGARPSQ
jgi:hypothetical protein